MEGHFTDEGIVDYAFGEYADDGRQRVLSVTSSEVTPSLLQNLAKVSGSRARQRTHTETMRRALPFALSCHFAVRTARTGSEHGKDKERLKKRRYKTF